MDQLPSIAGATPTVFWYTLLGLFALATIYILYGNVVKTYRSLKQMRDPGNKLADDISKKVVANIEPRFEEINRKLANDKATIDSHTRQIEALNKRTDTQDAGIRALCHGMLALLDNAERCGNGCKEITEAKKSFTDYLADK